ncbi:helix-turn-helix domain-containing protein [Pantoea sp. 18069]|uniref:helix-turn-helix domain-containing protein n=1 Tax=Pantoea sp. 18069 TaxID=2681415 RepID=UPI001F35C765|nr:helix-turn-helix domain-containing protein [Pantoea sp. 18069]
MQSFNGRLHMPRKSPFDIELSAEESAELNRRATRYTLPYFEVIRAKMILMAASGIGNDEIAARLDTRREVVSQWRQRFFKQRLAGLEERARSGRPRVFPPRAHD